MGYSQSSVAAGANLPMYTLANGYAKGRGTGFANPSLVCDQVHQGCTYVPYVAGCSNANNGQTSAMFVTFGNTSYWAYSRGQNWAFVDGHVKFRRVGASATSDYRTDPWTAYDATGRSASYWWDGCHPWLFRPDYDFSL